MPAGSVSLEMKIAGTFQNMVEGPELTLIHHAKEAFALTADWGTTSLRLWAFSFDGTILAQRRSAEGLSVLSREDFEPVLRAHIAHMQAEVSFPNPLPVVLCGMAGSRQGWQEAPYLTIPAHLDALIPHAISKELCGIDVRILPGLSQREPEHPDVMRGEETQLLGLAGKYGDFSGLVCMPGTHSKWVRLENGSVREFSTSITGELFGLLSKNSIIKHSIGEAFASAEPTPAFRQGIAEGLADPSQLLTRLFALRARDLLFESRGPEAADRLSGLLIGTEAAANLHGVPKETGITIIAATKFMQLYAFAIGKAGYPVIPHDADAAVQAGLLQAAQKFWPATENLKAVS